MNVGENSIYRLEILTINVIPEHQNPHPCKHLDDRHGEIRTDRVQDHCISLKVTIYFCNPNINDETQIIPIPKPTSTMSVLTDVPKVEQYRIILSPKLATSDTITNKEKFAKQPLL